ncbi:TraB/GumN family protein [Panacagrimonas sp.]|uniref:TraB/GumN family protein n=1 Tax=Panacagrimonas sp. TaxID=2480088 RepID=UPI003B520511
MKTARYLFGLWLALLGGASQAADAPFLWKVQGERATHYVMGSVHVLPRSAYPLPQALQQAYDDTRELVLETDPAALAAPQMREHMLRAAASGQGLAQEVGTELHRKVQSRARELELPAEICDPFKAWFCGLTLGLIEFQRAGMDPSLGLDQHFYRQAQSMQRPIAWLETPQAQFELFIGMDAQMSRQFLQSTLQDFERPELQPDALIELWQRNDTRAMERFIVDTARDFPRFHRRMMSERNRAWAAALVPRLQGAAAQLVIVGAGHLLGPDSLLQELRARGFAVEPVVASGS